VRHTQNVLGTINNHTASLPVALHLLCSSTGDWPGVMLAAILFASWHHGHSWTLYRPCVSKPGMGNAAANASTSFLRAAISSDDSSPFLKSTSFFPVAFCTFLQISAALCKKSPTCNQTRLQNCHLMGSLLAHEQAQSQIILTPKTKHHEIAYGPFNSPGKASLERALHNSFGLGIGVCTSLYKRMRYDTR
jgi:hypothetical protein